MAAAPAGMPFDARELGESDDFVEYWLHLTLEPEELPPGGDLREALQARCAVCMAYARQWCDGYIWQRDPFTLVPCPDVTVGPGGAARPCLYGRTYWGENIDDEWFIVWLLLQMTKRWPTSVATVTDNDGQFLLIEACEAIPRWIKPDNAAHRVHLAGGQLHIVPLAVPQPLTAARAVAAVRADEASGPTLASPAVQEALSKRLAPFDPKPPRLATPQALHRARLYLPARIFAILRHSPELVAPAVEAFCARDPIDMRLCAKMEAFPPASRVFGLVTFSRCLYAQLQGQRTAPPKPFGPLPAEGSEDHKAQDLGVKLACGFEILLQTGRRNLRRAGVEPDTAGAAPPALAAPYAAALERSGYYEECGCGDAAEREAAEGYAARVWARMEEDEPVLAADGARFAGGEGGGGPERQKSEASASLAHSRSVRSALQIEAALAKEERQASDAEGQAQAARAARAGRLSGAGDAKEQQEEAEEDSDDWLAVSESDVDEMLKNFGGPAAASAAAAGKRADGAPPTAAEQEEMAALSARMRGFLDGASGLEGVGDEEGAAGAAGEGGEEDMAGEMGKILRMMEGLMSGQAAEMEAAGMKPVAGMEEQGSEDEDDAFYDGEGSGDEEEGEEEARARQEAAEALAYMEQMDAELKLGSVGGGDPSLGSRLGESFVRRPAPVPAEGAAARAAVGAAGEEGAQGAVDVDANLVHNLMESFQSQEGNAGPASNLIGMLQGAAKKSP